MHAPCHVQAEHEASVTSVGMSPDGLAVCIGTENGTVGVLDVPTHQYRTLLRSHVGPVNCVAADPNRWVGGERRRRCMRGVCA